MIDSQIGGALLKLVVGVVLILVAPRVVGALLTAIGAGFILLGGIKYVLGSFTVTPGVVFPVLMGLVIVLIGKSLAETALRIAGGIAVLWALWDLGLLRLM